MNAIAARVDPLLPPYHPEVQAVFDRLMPPGVPPLRLFTTLARVPRTFERLRAAALLDAGPLSLRFREIVIHRTCARCGCAYEWGVHAAFFAQRAALTPDQLSATLHGDGETSVWTDEESLLIRVVDELYDSADISDELWGEVATCFSTEQIFEVIALTGYYHTVSFFSNAMRLAPEAFGVPFPESR